MPEFALVDPVTLNTGLFRSLPKGAKLTLGSTKEHGGLTYHYGGHHVDDIGLRVFLTLLGLAGMQKKTVPKEGGSENLRATRQGLELQGSAEHGKCLLWFGSILDLVSACGSAKTTSNKKTVLVRLRRLSEISISAVDTESGETVASQRLLNFAVDPTGKQVAIVLSPHISSAVLGGQYVKIHLKKLRSIGSAAGQVLHAVLSARIRPSQSFPVPYRLATLAEIAFGPSATLTIARKRIQLIRDAVHGLEQAGWAVFEDLTGNRAISIMHLDKVDPNKWIEIEARRAKVA
nr:MULTISPECIES: replication protein C, IncQ-type [unclassified Aliiroseovarius]